jgi:hypothetical protein
VPVAISTCPASTVPRRVATRHPPPADRAQPGHQRVLVDARAVARRGFRQPDAEAPDMQHGAARMQDGAVEGVRPDLGRQVGARQQARLRVGRGQRRVALRQLGDMLGLGRQLDLAGAAEVAGDPLLRHHRLDRVDRRVVGAIERQRPLGTEAGGGPGEVVREAVVAVAAVAAGRLADDAATLQHHHVRPGLAQRQRRRQAGEAAADDRHVGAAGDRPGGRRREGRRGVEPVGFELHPRGRAGRPRRRSGDRVVVVVGATRTVAAVDEDLVLDADVVGRHQVVAQAGGDVQHVLGVAAQRIEHVLEGLQPRLVGLCLLRGVDAVEGRAQQGHVVLDLVVHAFDRITSGISLRHRARPSGTSACGPQVGTAS